ncbi:hypothetical protein BST61_g444 [Cercospora zeina]
MVYGMGSKAQPGDGSWLLLQDGGGSQKQPKKRRNRRRGKKTETFLARQHSVVGADGDDAAPGMQSLPGAADSRTCGASCDNEHAASSALLTSHRLLAAKPHSKFPLHASAQPRLTTWLQTPVQQDCQSSARGTAETAQTLTSPMAIPPHLRRKAAEASAALDQTVTNKPPSRTSALPPSRNATNEDIIPKLRSLGVKVMDSKEPFSWSHCSLKNESAESSLPNPESLTASDKPASRGNASVRGRRGGQQGRGGQQRRDDRHGRDGQQVRGDQRGRGGSHGGQSKTQRTYTARGGGAFCKSSEIPKGDPKRWETDWVGQDAAAFLSRSDRAKTSSWDKKNSRQDNRGGNSGWDQQSQHSDDWTIQIWNKDLPPPPLLWDSRSSFRKGQSEQQIQRWLDLMEGVAMQGIVRQPNLDDLSVVDGFTYTFGSPQNPVEGTKYVTMGDIAPHYWDNINSTAPPPVDQEDLAGAQPWWALYVEGGSFLQPWNTHDHNGIDPSESVTQTKHRENDFGSQHATDNKRRYELAKQGVTAEKLQRREVKEAKKAAAKAAHGGLTPEHLRPVNHSVRDLFLRYASSDDMEAVRDIYNYYVDFTTSAPETKRVTVMELREQFSDIVYVSKLPYLVAYEKGQIIKGRKKKGYRYDEEPVQLPDTVVGFIRAQEYGNGTDAYRISVRVEVFIHKEYLMKGIATCLMDKMLALLDPGHNEKGGYLVYGDDLDAAKPNPRVKNIVVHFLYASERPEKHEQIHRWLVGNLQFQETGTIQEIGSKQAKLVSKTTFVRKTGAVLDGADTTDAMH